MKLLTVGDSFTYGEELADTSQAWPCLLADKLGYEVTNLAKPGSGNTRMIRHVVEQAKEFDLTIIAWSHFARIEFADDNGAFDIWPGSRPDPHRQHSPWRSQLIDYVTKYHDDQYLYHQHLVGLILTQDYLKQHNKRYIMVDTFENGLMDRLQAKETELIKQIDTEYYLGWPNETMMEWTYGVAQGPGGHFLEDGHRLVADKIYEHIRHLSWLS